ncbi:MAG: Rieske 2Fe-2S domain-containing protein, partial [Rhodospirillaceae bacterium]|nr:Rieske 2Fe-2S domain-containing protein [Rhodospirillaceae bacterium]
MEGVAAVSTEKTKDIDYVEVCAEDELWDGEMDAFDVGDHEILLVHFGQQYFAYDGLCPHQSVALSGSGPWRTETCPGPTGRS